jgi:hypothetical protein
VSHTATTREGKTSPTPPRANQSDAHSVSDHVGCFADDDDFPTRLRSRSFQVASFCYYRSQETIAMTQPSAFLE